MQELLNAGYNIIVDVDLKSNFDTIPKDRLMALTRQKVADTQVESFLDKESSTVIGNGCPHKARHRALW